MPSTARGIASQTKTRSSRTGTDSPSRSDAPALFSAERLTLARRRRGLIKQELAALVGVTPAAISLWENDRGEPSAEHMTTLARVLEFPREFFFGGPPPSLERAAFRSLARMTARPRHMALAAGAQAVALDRWIDGQFERPAPDVPDLRSATPDAAADAVRALWGLGYHAVPNLVHVLEAHGVRVYSLVHDGAEIDAFSDWQDDVPFVFLNTTKSAERSRMDAAHELGHLVLHAHTAGGASKAHEDEAQAFASAFLMPKGPFLATAPRRVSLAAVVEAKQRWGVSALAYVYRLHALGRLTDWQYNSLCIKLKTQYGTVEPGPLRARETSQVLAKVLAPARDGGGASRKEIAQALHLPLRDLDDITFGLTLTPLIGGARATAATAESPPPGDRPMLPTGPIRLVK